jgi:polyhydroxyalkanoate synthesis regulator phasin
MIKKQKNKKKIYSKKRVLRGGFNTDALIYDDALHSLLSASEHIFSDKEKILQKQLCEQWFSNIKKHGSYNAVIKDGLVNKGSENAKEAVRLCQEFHPELTLEKINSDEEFDRSIENFILFYTRFNIDELKEVLFQIKRKFVELKRLVNSIAAAPAPAAYVDDYDHDGDVDVDVVDARAAKRSSNPIYNTDDAIIKLRNAFIRYTRSLFNSASVTDEASYRISLKDLKKLFGKLVFKIGSQPIPEKQGFFIEVEKHSFLGLHSSSRVNCESLKLFDDFVNKIMEFINTSEILMQKDDSSSSSEPTSKRLFLVLTSVGESYKKIMKVCGIEKPYIHFQTCLSIMRQLGLPDIEYAKLRDNFNIDSPFAVDAKPKFGGSKTRRRHRHKLVRKTRHKRGERRVRSYAKRRCASKSHKRRRSR